MEKSKRLFALIAIASVLTISTVAFAAYEGWFDFLYVSDLSLDEIKMTDELRLKDLPLWFEASVTVEGSGYIGQEHDVDISISHARPDESVYEAAGDFSLVLEYPAGTPVTTITSGSFSDLREGTPYDNPTYAWTPNVGAELYTIALIIDNVVWEEKEEYTITASAEAEGSIEPLGATTVLEGDDQTFTITPDSGYTISSLVVDGVPIDASSSHTFYDIHEDHSIHATFTDGMGTYSESNAVLELGLGTFAGDWTGALLSCKFGYYTLPDITEPVGTEINVRLVVGDDGPFGGYFWDFHFEAERLDGTERHELSGTRVTNYVMASIDQQANVNFDAEAGEWTIIFVVDAVRSP